MNGGAVNAREVMRRAFRETVGIPEGDYFRSDVFDAQLDALAEAGFVVVACPPGSRVVVSRESKPCEPCGGAGQWYHQDTYDAVSCESCGGSGVVEATTIHGLADASMIARYEDGEPIYLNHNPEIFYLIEVQP